MEDVSPKQDGDQPGDLIARVFEALPDYVASDAVRTHLDLGRAYAEMGLLTDAVNEFERALELDPGNPIGRAALQIAKAHVLSP